MNNPDLHISQQALESFSNGDVNAFTNIYNRYYPDLYFLSRRLVGDAAPDVVADVFVQLWSQKKRFDSDEHLLFYLRVMTRNACFDLLKKEHRTSQQLKELSYITDQEHEDVYFREIIEARLFSLIQKEIDQLPSHMREVFKLSYIDGLKNAEIAALLNIKDASVRVRKAEALK
ncbi:MAG TPA: sigma-70 family RNA polymerase sigma factor, partial [Chitinophagaceae bacterium]|nr:sigma-70 family RNA polymerase sigma factor [Chitinophagaceae bacterium]